MYHAGFDVTPLVLLAAISFEDDKHVVGSSKSPSLPLDPAQPAPGFKVLTVLLLT
jgi:hypothetical protein